MTSLFLKWAAWIQGFLMHYGVLGLAGVSVVDSGLIPLPEAVDAIVITLCIKQPHNMLWYVIAATVGSVLGCLVPYYLGKSGGHAFLERRVGKRRADRFRTWFEKYEFLTVMLPALLPPPTPLKAFLLVAGVAEVHLVKLIVGLLVGRGLRFLLEGLLAVRYGSHVWGVLRRNGAKAAVLVIILMLVWFIGARFLRVFRGRRSST